ncbi:MAG: 4-(cytidine 5'-diphospho)-2-C-methyl-D-erythritol kinase [Planctomycetota bacterium]|jgi:4-diphosphocytidyl-2-C-methyl-D-erythritol kinase
MTHKEQITTTENGLLIRAPAKINLSLLVSGKRPDDFHEIETIIAKINWYDEILIQQNSEPGIELICKGQTWAPPGEENLVYQACESLSKAYNSSGNIKITLTKNIPAQSGLGSASSDAAATLIAVSKFLNLAPDPQKIYEIAAELGSDVPFFLGGPLSFCIGKGDIIKKIDKIFDFLVLLILPDVSVSTAEVYNDYKENAALYKKLKYEIDGYMRKNRIDLITKMCANMLQISCFRLYDELTELKEKIESLLSRPLCLSGSGSTMYCFFDKGNSKEALYFKHKLKEKVGCNSIIANNNRW